MYEPKFGQAAEISARQLNSGSQALQDPTEKSVIKSYVPPLSFS